MKFTDTHCHIYTEQFDGDRDQIIERAEQEGVTRFLLPAIDAEYISRLSGLVAEHKNIYGMYGLHPCSVNEGWQEELNRVEAQLFGDKKTFEPIAVGEIGMDLYWDKSFFKEQVEALITQVNWAKQLNLPIVIHVRDAFNEIFEVLDDLNDENMKGVFHCFTGNLEQAEHILNYGDFKLGIGGVLTFKNAGLDKVIEQIDLKHLVLETDSPYLAPHPNRGKRNEPSYIKLVAQKLSEIKGISIEEIARITEENTNSVFFPNL